MCVSERTAQTPSVRLGYLTGRELPGRMARTGLGGARGSRTPDLLNAIQALSQLSYGP
jgi:hypothetical protein